MALGWVMGRRFPPPQWTLLCQIRCVCTALPAVFVYKKLRQEPIEWYGWHQDSHRRFGEFPQFPNSPAKISFNFVMSCRVMRPRWWYSTHLCCFAKWASSWMLRTSSTSRKCDVVTPRLWLVGRHHHGTKNSTRKAKQMCSLQNNYLSALE